MSFWDIVWFIIISFAFVSYLMALWWILGDLFQDSDLSGWAKAIWIVALLFVPFLSVFIYLVTRGRKMAERSAQHAEARRQQQDAYIKGVAGNKPTAVDEITKAQSLLDAHVISQDEFDKLKARALA
jgi:ABC-type multidrug transport system fused ATPase/permease subunit